MTGICFWDRIESLSAEFDGDASNAESILTSYARDAVAFPANERAVIQRQLLQILGGVSSLQSRILDAEKCAERQSEAINVSSRATLVPGVLDALTLGGVRWTF